MSLFLQILGFAAAFLALGGYYISVQRANITVFNWTNLIASLVMFPLNWYYGAYFSAFLNFTYGLLGLYGIIVSKRNMRNKLPY